MCYAIFSCLCNILWNIVCFCAIHLSFDFTSDFDYWQLFNGFTKQYFVFIHELTMFTNNILGEMTPLRRVDMCTGLGLGCFLIKWPFGCLLTSKKVSLWILQDVRIVNSVRQSPKRETLLYDMVSMHLWKILHGIHSE